MPALCPAAVDWSYPLPPPLPEIVNGSPATVIPPCRASVAPNATVVPAPGSPRAVPLRALTMPALIVVGPA